jgi:putative addiction module component (TIGR02574 family)
MTTQTKDLIELAVSLPIEDKALLVDRVLDSMYPHQSEIDELWKAEAERRVEEIRTGAVKPIPGNEVLAEINERFGQ